MPPVDEWVVVRNCVWIQEALVIRSLLDAEEIQALIPDENFLGNNAHYGLALGGVRVMVRSTDLKQACAILDAAEVSETDSEHRDADDVS